MSGRLYRFSYESSPGQVTEWVKTLDELLTINGSESLLDYMLRELDSRDGFFLLEVMPDVEPARAFNVTEYYCSECHHPWGYHSANDKGCSMPVVKGTHMPISRTHQGESAYCGCTRGRE